MQRRSLVIVQRMVLLTQQQVRLRVVSIDARTGQTWLIGLDDNEWPKPHDSFELQRQVDDGETTIIQDPWGTPRHIDEASRSYVVMVRRHDLLKPFMENMELILVKRLRSNKIAAVPITRQAVTYLLKQFLKRGMNREALLPDYFNCGRRDENWVLKKEAEKRGARRTIDTGKGINVDEDVKKYLAVGASLWLTSKDVTLKSALHEVLRLYYSTKVTDPITSDVKFIEVEDKKPTVRQLHYYIQTNYTKEYARRKRNGAAYYELNERALLGWADSTVQGPGDEFQIDATVANIPLVSQFDRRWFVGYPVIYFLVDVFSRLITGIYAGFEGPSWSGAGMSLVSMVTPKVEFCKRYGVNITEDQWPSHYAPKKILADKGELLSIRLGHNIIQELGIDIDNTPSGRPDYKAFVERNFGTMKADFRDYVPGYAKQEFDKIPIEDSRLRAVLNLREFMKALIHVVLLHNMTPIRDLRIPPEMVTEGLPPSPLELWNWGIANRSGTLHTLSVEKTMLNVLHRDQATVTEKGFRYHGANYLSETSIREEWFARARRGQWKVDVLIEPWDLGQIILLDKHLPRGYELCEQIPSNVDHSFKSLYEVEELELAGKRNIAQAIRSVEPDMLLQEYEIKESFRKAAEQKNQLSDTRSKSQKVREIGQAHADEKAAERNDNSILDALGLKIHPPAPPTQETPTQTPYDEDVAIRLKKDRERRKVENNNEERKTT